MIDEVYSAFEGWTHELLRYALAHPLRAGHAQPDDFSSGTFRIGAKIDEVEDERKLG